MNNQTDLEPLYRNTNYSVVAFEAQEACDILTVDDVEYTTYYEVINNMTGVAERKTNILPSALNAALELNRALEEELWKPENERKSPSPKLQIVPKLN